MTRPPNSRRWDPADLEELRRLARLLPPSRIAEALDRTLTAVRTKAAHRRIRLQAEPSDRHAAAAPPRAGDDQEE